MPQRAGRRPVVIGGWPGPVWVVGAALGGPGWSEQASLRRLEYGENTKFRHLVEQHSKQREEPVWEP